MYQPKKEFEKFYAEMFGGVLGSEDNENRDHIRRIWNAMLEHVAKQYEFQLFEELTGDQISDQIRRMKVGK